MKLYLLFIMYCLFAACNVSDDGRTQTVKKICEACSEEEVCFEEQCCVPQTECLPDQCGEVSDGCSSTLDCGLCGCFNDNFAEFCPSKPCKIATACDDARTCVYEPVECGGRACLCDTVSCTDSDLRDCRDQSALVCPADFCDPSPIMENGALVFQNTCVQPEGANCDFSNLCAAGTCTASTCIEADCGICNLGAWECAPMTTDAKCSNIPTPVADLDSINCNSNSANSTFIYLDHIDGIDADGSGTKAQPFLTLETAVTAAKQRGAKGVIIRSGLIQTKTLIVENGISLYGGFSGAPDWKYDGGAFNVDVNDPDPTGNIIAVMAHDITERTVLFRVNIRSSQADVQKSSSYGVHALNATALVLQEVNITSGRGSNGAAGTIGKAGRGGSNGLRGLGRAPGGGGVNLACPLANGSQGGFGAKRGDLPGRNGEFTPKGVIGGTGGIARKNGEPGRRFPTATIAGSPGSGGQGGYNLLANFYTPTGDGELGTDSGDGAGGSGGGGSGGVSVDLNIKFEGGGGGGGAAGGCGGTAGQPGLAGGGSFGVFAFNSTGIEIINSSIKSGDAGRGGRGGAGGQGGLPGGVGLGGTPVGIIGLVTLGGRGGTGRAGGAGGSGGGGAGGDTYALFCENTQITPVETTLEYGIEGMGGISIENGENGKSGESLNCEN